MEDHAGPHAHGALDMYYSALNIQQLSWTGNSPDLNAIEPCSFYIKRETTRGGVPFTHAEAE